RSQAEGEAVYQRMLDFAEDLKQRKLLLAVESLVSQDGAARVTVRSGAASVVDGPFAEAKEMVGGFFLLDCKTREEAVAIAGQCPAAEWATLEVRGTGPCYS
ncbi:MAG: YciI family protein, partial [Ramlibacter sp.]